MNGMEGVITPEMAGGMMAMMGAFFVFFLFLGIAVYVFMAICLQTIAKKTNTENAWLAWIPVANIFLVANIAKKPVWWAILCFIPIINIVAGIVLAIGVAEARGKESWMGILMIIPGVNLIVLGYLAFSN
ncbi:MAG: hypothetical protein A2231_04305 [Candidatus Firestonebacteria bacterium RIFOXYA2_FULL_40_8]|nr:MAG: hypothetical protein A2231_04305 [Candidatus Firestonebacteria bacterium RIFOXYA2_FULL_40_8]